jgi:hypothetical protein
MADNNQCTDVFDATSELVVLGVQVADKTIKDLPTIVAKALDSEEFRNKVRDALDAFAKKQMASTWSFSPIDPKAQQPIDPKAFARQLVDEGAMGLVQDAIKQVQQSAQYKQLEDQAKKVAAALKCSPVGVWVDKHSGWVYVVALGVVIGGAAALYVTRTGDTVTKPLSNAFGTKPISFKVLGKLEMGVSGLKFLPEEHQIEAKPFASLQWDKVQLRLDVAVKAVNQHVSVTPTGTVVLPLDKDVTLKATGSYDSDKKQGNVGVGVDIKLGKKIDLNLGASYGTPSGKPGDPSSGFRATATITIPLP